MATQSSWYQVIKDVVVQGSPESIHDAKGLWDAQIKRLRSVADQLREGTKDQATAWNSPAGQAFAAHLQQMASDVEALCSQLAPAPQMLAAAEGDLIKAQKATPIPAKYSDVVFAAHVAFMSTGRADLSLLADGLADGVDKLRSAFGDSDEKAVAEAKALDGKYQAHNAAADSGTDKSQYGDTKADASRDSSGRSPSGVDGLGANSGLGSGRTSGLTPSALDGLGRGDGSGYGSGSGSHWDDSGNPWDQFRNATGLAGAGDGAGLSGVGAGGGGLGGSGLAGAGGGGLAGAGAGTGGFGAGLTPSSTLGPLVGAKGAGGGLGAGAGSGAGAAGAGAGGVGMGAGAGHGAGGGEGDAHETWLKEDEDVWGVGDLPGISGGTLGGGYV